MPASNCESGCAARRHQAVSEVRWSPLKLKDQTKFLTFSLKTQKWTDLGPNNLGFTRDTGYQEIYALNIRGP